MISYRVSLTPKPPPMRARVERLETLVQHLPQVDCPVEHEFYPGVYIRTMTVPVGVVATGAVHKTEHVTLITQGHCLLTTDQGVKEIRAPFAVVSKPGIKRAITTMETTVLKTIHLTSTTDLDALVSELTESNSAQLLGGAENAQLLLEKS